MSVTHIKTTIVGAIAILSSIPFWFFYSDMLQKETYGGVVLAYSILFLSLYLIAMSILLLFAERSVLFFIPVAVSIAPLIYFFGFSLLAGVLGFMYTVLVFHAFSRVRGEIKSRIRFKPFFLLRQGIPLTVSALSLVLAGAYFIQTSRSPERITIRDILPPTLTSAILDRLTPFTERQFGVGLNTTYTVDEYIAEELTKTGIDISDIPKEERERIVAEMRHQLSQSFAKYGDPFILTGNEKLGDVLYQLIERRSETLLEPYRRYVPVAFAIGFFLFLRTIAFPYGWLILWISSGVIFLLQRMNVIRRIEKQTVQERFEWT